MVTCKILRASDVAQLIELINIYNDVFETENSSVPSTEYLQTLLGQDEIIFCVAVEENAVAGGLTAYVLPSVYYPAAQVYLYDLAVERNMQRQGIGRKLLSCLSDYCTQSGHREMYVQADADDAHAIEFYQSTGAQPQPVVHFSYLTDSTF